MIPIARPLLSEDEKAKVLAVLDSGMITTGAVVEEFEQAFARYIGAASGCATSSGTTALHLALMAAGVGFRDKVVTTPFSFIATANAILFCGAEPVFCDIDPLTYNLSPAALREVLTTVPGVKAILVVHLFGLPAAMDEIQALADEFGCLVIEDCAQAHGAEYKGRKVGRLGACSAFSFYPTKNMTTGEGGMVCTDDSALIRQVRLLREHGTDGEYRHQILGYNFRMTNLEAAIGLVQLGKLPGFNAARQAHAQAFDLAFADLAWVTRPVVPAGCVHVYHQYTIRVPAAARDRLGAHLKARQVGHKVYYPLPIHQQPLYQKLGFGNLEYPESSRAAREVISLPVHPGVSTEDRERIIMAVREFKP